MKSGKSLPWQKPWIGYGRPRNYVTQKKYSGINLLLFPTPGEYITFKQIKTLQKSNPSIKLKKGSKSNMVVFWKFLDKNKNEDIKESELELPVPVNQKGKVQFLDTIRYFIYHV
ncbi:MULTISPECIES: ArdC-like ssDNA-binding domain-containing protein [Clostridium]|uniref:ArdC-like ssDNA-binding domain-containing protein n=1 Tax=Clostridium lapidicellarium TaxID=3240931 RepID=A0ABV4DX16_9CLOT